MEIPSKNTCFFKDTKGTKQLNCTWESNTLGEESQDNNNRDYEIKWQTDF